MKGFLADPLVGQVAMSAVTAGVTAVIVLVHYNGLHGLSVGLRRLPGRPRPRLVVLILALLGLHGGEVGLFGAAYFLCWQAGGLGGLGSLHPELVAVDGFFDHLYFSAVVYTTVRFGDIVPQGPIRLLAGSEAITGLVLITWSASYTFLEMQRYWREGHPER